jgi:hypothetical protein
LGLFHKRGMPRFTANNTAQNSIMNNEGMNEREDHDAISVASGELERGAEGIKETIAKRETKVVLFLKLAALVVLVSSALGVALWTFNYVADSETSQFKDKFSDDAHKIFESIGSGR